MAAAAHWLPLSRSEWRRWLSQLTPQRTPPGLCCTCIKCKRVVQRHMHTRACFCAAFMAIKGRGAQHEVSVALGRQVHSPIRRVQALTLRSGHAAPQIVEVGHMHRTGLWCLAQSALFQGLEAGSYLL